MTGTVRICVPLAILLTAVPAAAQKQKKAMVDMQNVQVPVRQAPVPKAEENSGPTMTLEEFTGRQQARIQKINDQQIIYLQNLIKLAAPDDPQLPDYLFRLGELFAEKYRYWNNRTRSLDEDIFRAEHGDDSSMVEPQRHEQQRDRAQADQALRTSVRHFLEVAKYPRYLRMDEVLYRLGYLLQVAGHADRSRTMFHRLLKEFPQSRYVPDACLAFGDDAFAKGDMPEALAFYTKVTQFPRASVYGFALYKKAWAQANLGDFKAALDTLVNLLGQCQSENISKSQRGPLEREARHDLVKIYAHTPGADPDRALDFFHRAAGVQTPQMMQILAELYWDQGMPANSSRAYRKVMSLASQSPSLCAWQCKILRNTLSAGSEPEQVQELQRLGNTYHYLQQLGTVRADVMNECRSNYRNTSRELAFVLHKQAQRTKQRPTYELAATAYREFLGDFESDPTSVETAFYYAECLWQLAALSPPSDQLWRQAAEQYTHVIHLNPKGAFVKEAAYASVLAWQNAVYENDEDLRPRRQTF